MGEVILKERETREKLVETINQSGLPAFMLKSMLKDLFEQVNQLEEVQYQEALKNKEQEANKKNSKKGEK